MDPLLNSEFNHSEENLLTAIAEVSYDDRENDPDALSKVKKIEEPQNTEKGPDSLPDARAKVLHLKRVQRNGENGGSTDRKSDNDEVEEENEETVNFSLDAIIRRGLGEQKINTSFQKAFPDFGSSEEAAEHLTALLHKNPLTAGENKKGGNSSREHETDDDDDDDDDDEENEDNEDEKENTEEADDDGHEDTYKDDDTEADEGDLSTINYDSSVPPTKRRGRGRPKLTDEERERRGIVKKTAAPPSLPGSAKRRGRPPKQIGNVPLSKAVKVEATDGGTTAVDHLMALGHSLFSEIQPKKRGRKPKRDPYLEQFFDSSQIDAQNESLDTEHENSGLLNSRNGNQIIFQNNELTVTEIPAAARGIPQNALAPNQPKKRGRKPKHMISIPIESVNSSMIDMSETDTIDTKQSIVVTNTTLPGVNQPKKRGRKPKWMLNNISNVSQDTDTDFESSIIQNVISVAPASTASVSAGPAGAAAPKKRGRKPKSYYIEQQQKQYMNATAPPRIEHSESRTRVEPHSSEKTVHYEYKSGKLGRFVLAIPSGQTLSSHNDTNNSTDLNSSIDQEPPLKKKRGRKPKGYYERLAQEESFAEQNHAVSQESIASIKEPTISPVYNQSNASTTNVSVNDSLLAMPKKRGRKPKSYYLQLEQQQNHSFGGTVENHSTPIRSAISADNTMDSSYGEPSVKQISGGILNHKRVPIPNLKRYEIENTIQMPKQENFQLPKKRGRKPKNYVPENDVPVGERSSPVHKNNAETNLSNYTKILETRNRSLVETLDKRNNEIQSLKSRLTTANINKHQNGDVVEINQGSWTQDQLAQAFTMKRLSPQLFNLMRDKYNISLPIDGLIADFIQSIYLTRGIQSAMLSILANDGKLMEEHERLTILQTSIIRLADIYEYHEQSDSIWGPNKFVVAIVASGLFREWHQLVYLNFDIRVNKTILNSVIEALHEINFQVVACTCNFEEGQPNIWAELDVSYGRHYFSHPNTGAQIFAFYFLDDLLAATNKHFLERNLAIDQVPINRDSLLIIIHRMFRKVAIDKELLEWTDSDHKNTRATKRFFSQYTIDLLRIASPDDRPSKVTAEFINIIKSFADIMTKKRAVEIESNNVNFEMYVKYQIKKIEKVHARLFKIQCNLSDQLNKQFREAIMMSSVSLRTMLSTLLQKYQYSTFCTHIITHDVLKEKFAALCDTYNYDTTLPPIQTFRIFKHIFLNENCSVKLEVKHKFFHSGSLKADDGKKESDFVKLLFDHMVSVYKAKYPTKQDFTELRNKLKGMEAMFRDRQDPNFRIREGVASRVVKKMLSHGFGLPADFIQTFVVQRHLLRVKYLNENKICSIPHDIEESTSSIVDTITLDE